MADVTGESVGLNNAYTGPAPPGSDAFDVARRFYAGAIDHQPDPLFAQARCKLAEIVPGRVWFMMAFCNVIIVKLPPPSPNDKPALLLVDAGAASAADHIVDVLSEAFFADGIFVSHCVYTHGHVDHVGAIPFIELAQKSAGHARPIELWAHERTAARFKRYVETSGYNARINARQFAIDHELLLPVFEGNRPPDKEYSRLPGFDRATNTFVLNINGLAIHLIHAKGETDDGTVVFLPKQSAEGGGGLCPTSVVCPGDLVINCVPNCGNPQKVQRFPFDWCESLRRVGALRADVMLPGHGPLAASPALVADIVSESAQYLQSICEQTLALLNRNVPLNDITRLVAPPRTTKPYLRPVYDDPSFIVRNVYRLYGGWYTGYLPELHPAPHHHHGADIVRLSGGIKLFMAFVDQMLTAVNSEEEGKIKLRRALALVEPVAIFVAMKPAERGALCADQGCPVVSRADTARFLALRRHLLTALSKGETSLMGRRIYAAGARDGPHPPAKL